jgi:unsaturated chondroitin disaccharide hydrolase
MASRPSAAPWQDAARRVLVRMDDTRRRIGARYPHWSNTDTGEWTTTADGDWTGGYWAGMHWLASRLTGEARWQDEAARLADGLRGRIAADTVFKSFPIYYGATLGALLADRPPVVAQMTELTLACAATLVRAFDPQLGLVPLGGQAEEGAHIGGSETSIDSMQTAPFLFRAALLAGNDARMREVATSHADRILALHLRDDDSFIQSTSLDPRTGLVARHYTHKGISDTSTWGRAQAWGMLYSTMSFLHDRTKEAWLAGAMRGADWWLKHVPADRVAFWDFDDPAIPRTERDTAATSIATAALLRLATVAPGVHARKYREFAEETAAALVAHHLTPVGPDDRRPVGMLVDACFNKRPDARAHDAAARCEFIVGDYYFFESLLALAGVVDPTRL